MFFEDYSCFNFIRLKSGKYAAKSGSGVFVSEKTFDIDEEPEGLSYLKAMPASREESDEYFNLKTI